MEGNLLGSTQARDAPSAPMHASIPARPEGLSSLGTLTLADQRDNNRTDWRAYEEPHAGA